MTKPVALITGSSKGIGAGIARVLGKNGYQIVVTYKSDEMGAKNTVKEIETSKGEAVYYQVDVTDEVSVKGLFGKITKDLGRLDVLVNNAALDSLSPIEKCSFEEWKKITRIKIDGNFLCTKYALPLLKKSDNANLIIIMSSIGEKPDPDDPAYSVATAANICFMKAMARALAKYKIRTNGVGPGETRTANGYWADLGNTDELWDKLAKDNLLGRVCTPEDVGKTVLSIVEDKTKFWNGNVIYVNGGGHLI